MYKVDYKVSNIRNAPALEDLHIGGRIEKQMETFFYERVSSDFAKEVICGETEEQFRLKLDDLDAIGMYRGEFWGKFALSGARVARYHKDAELAEFLRQSAYRVLETADEEGYFGTYKNKENIFPCTFEESMAARGIRVEWNWNIWGRKYSLWALLEIYELTGDKKILDAAHKFAVQIINMLKKLGVHTGQTGAFHGMPSDSIMKPMLVLYRLTGDERCLEFAQKIADQWEDPNGRLPNLITNGLAKTPVHTWYPDSQLWAKAYEMMSCLDGLLELYRITGTERYLTAVENIYEVLLEHEQNILFSVGFNDMFSNAAILQNSLTEPCDVIHWMRLCYELYCLTGKTTYMDSLELAFYNPFLSAAFADGKWGARAVRSFGRPLVGVLQSGMEHSHCCVNNMPRGFLNAAQSFVLTGEDGLHINLYSDFDCVIDSTKVTIGGTLFEDGKVNISVETDAAKKVYLRIPGWSKITLINGKEYSCCGSEVALDLKAGKNEINIQFDMTPLIREFPHEVVAYELPDYRIRRYITENPIPAELMRWERSATLMYGPLLLTRSKLIGNTEKEMFEDSSVCGKGLTANVTPVCDKDFPGNRYHVTFEGEGGFETDFCDYANGSNHWSKEDPKLYSVFV